jgi:hypothetical protein
VKDEIKLEVGKKYIIPQDGNELYTFIAEILAFPKDKDRQFVFTDSKDKYVFYSISYIKGIKEHIEESMQEETKEVKLEVGKEYNAEKGEIFVVISDLRKFAAFGDDYNYPFIAYHYDKAYQFNEKGNPYHLHTFKLVKEHREPFKQIFEGWVWYDSDMPLCRTNKKYYETKEECLRYTHNSTKAIKIRVTEEELPEQE